MIESGVNSATALRPVPNTDTKPVISTAPVGVALPNKLALTIEYDVGQ